MTHTKETQAPVAFIAPNGDLRKTTEAKDANEWGAKFTPLYPPHKKKNDLVNVPNQPSPHCRVCVDVLKEQEMSWYHNYSNTAIDVICRLAQADKDALIDCTPDGEDDPDELWELPQTEEYSPIATFGDVNTNDFSIGYIWLLPNGKIAIQNASPITVLKVK
jgi:hypothetical protein